MVKYAGASTAEVTLCGAGRWAEIVIACVFGMGFYLAVALAERYATRWQPRAEGVGR